MISLYTRTFNTPSRVVDYWISHHRGAVHKITVLDDGSNEEHYGYLEHLKSRGLIHELHRLERNSLSDEQRTRPPLKAMWSRDPAEVVIVLDIDECLYPLDTLAQAATGPIWKPFAYEAYTLDGPYRIPQGRHLERWPRYDKPCIIGTGDRSRIKHVPGWHRLTKYSARRLSAEVPFAPVCLFHLRFVNLITMVELFSWRLETMPETWQKKLVENIRRYVSGLFDPYHIDYDEAVRSALSNGSWSSSKQRGKRAKQTRRRPSDGKSRLRSG